jgi:hypothetical protein
MAAGNSLDKKKVGGIVNIPKERFAIFPRD